MGYREERSVAPPSGFQEKLSREPWHFHYIIFFISGNNQQPVLPNVCTIAYNLHAFHKFLKVSPDQNA